MIARLRVYRLTIAATVLATIVIAGLATWNLTRDPALVVMVVAVATGSFAGGLMYAGAELAEENAHRRQPRH